jgi:KDO2-lipid IV(A) lauroyltransferase
MISSVFGVNPIPALKVFFIKILLRVCYWLPLRGAHGLGVLIGTMAWLLPTDSRRISRRNLSLCFPELSQPEREQLVRSSLIETAKTACELGAVWLAPAPKALTLIQKVRGEEILQEALAAGKGVIVLAPHLGSWELCGLYLDATGPTTYLYKPPKLAAFEKAIISYRARAGARLAPTSRKGIAMLVRALEKGEIVGILPDQEPSPDSGIFAPFFGNKALTMTLVSKLAVRTGASVITMFAKRLEKGRGFELVFGRGRPAIADTESVVGATALNQSVEDCVRQAPSQYQWEYRRFKLQPDNSKNALYR